MGGWAGLWICIGLLAVALAIVYAVESTPRYEFEKGVVRSDRFTGQTCFLVDGSVWECSKR